MMPVAAEPPVPTGDGWQPMVWELRPVPEPVEAFRRFAALPHVLWLDSALRHAELGRYSFLAADPYECLVVNADEPLRDGLSELRRRWRPGVAMTVPGLPPFQGGAAGLFGYELGSAWERVPAGPRDEFRLPRLAVGWYDVVLAWDHVAGRAWLISQGFPESEPGGRHRRAQARGEQFLQRLAQAPGPCWQAAEINEPLPLAALEPNFVLPARPGVARLFSNFSTEQYLSAVERAVAYIRAGDIFQVNLSQRLLAPAAGGALELYLRLRARNPATFAAYFNLGPLQIVSASPERFLRVERDEVETRPIKGTRRRSHWPEADLFAGDELQASRKDRSENVMIVDLLRNDLSRVCRDDSVRVTQLCQLETYAYVQHLVSAVVGQLQPGHDAVDLLRATFPGGSITGAPKVRAMQIIAELEPHARGAYCGALGYLGFDGVMDTSILIRTVTAGRGWWQIPVGGGIVARSDPRQEYDETWHKAEGMLRAIGA